MEKEVGWPIQIAFLLRRFQEVCTSLICAMASFINGIDLNGRSIDFSFIRVFTTTGIR